MKNILLTMSVYLLLSISVASPDHDHGAPTFQPPKGGTLQSTHRNHFEMVKKDKTVYLYVYDQQGKSVSTKGLKLNVELEIPRKKTEAISLVDKDTHWESVVNAQGAHRFTLKIKIDDGKEKDDVKFTMENK